MTGTHGEIAVELAGIAAEFPGWHPWVSDTARWWATRKARRPANPPEWWAMTVDADDAEGLRRAITEQERLASDANRLKPGGTAADRRAVCREARGR